MHDHRLPRHDRPPEPWLPHPGMPEAPPQAPMPLTGGDWPASPVPTPRPGAGVMPGRLPNLRGEPSVFARFVIGAALGRKSIPVAMGLALLGPVGLFYISFLNGVAGLIIVSFVAHALAVTLVPAFGGGEDAAVRVGIFFCWLITVPWAVIAARRQNARRGS
jgi:hypothetical protein